MGRRLATVMVGVTCALLSVLTAHCDRLGPASVLPPFDLCCWCLATHETARGARCTRGSVTDCVQDLERLDIEGSETNLRCLRSVCGRECAFIAQLLPKEKATRDCCSCLSSSRQEGVACYSGSTDECLTEIEEGEINKLLQGGASCTQGVCQKQCEALFGKPQAMEDAGSPEGDAGGTDVDGGGGTTSSSSSGGNVNQPDGGPFLPWDGGCPLDFPCF